VRPHRKKVGAGSDCRVDVRCSGDDDGSTDGTAAILTADHDLGVPLWAVMLDRHRGKGAALRAGVARSRGDRVLMTDVDLSTPLDELVPLSAAIDQGAAVAMGSRAVSGASVLVHQPRWREDLGKLFNRLFRLLTGLPWRDTQCGFKLLERKAIAPLLERLTIDGYVFDAELCLLAHRERLVVAEVPVQWRNDPDTRLHAGTAVEVARDLIRIAYVARRRSRTN
jgi:dolichyl-phosphate beta-glucosyltransferase